MTSSTASQIGLITGELDKLSPRFDVSADSIEVLKSPAEFYQTLKVRSGQGIDSIQR
jgi:CDP-diacylglycerol--glycerol-3-phosphate 3-phosphatidyltransferase